MAFVFDNLVIDRVIDGVFRTHDMRVLGGLNQIQNLSINVTSESKDKTDAQGVLIKRFFTSQQAEISAENAIFSLSLLGLQNGREKVVADSTHTISLPLIKKYAKTESPITLPTTPTAGTVSVVGLNADGVPNTTLNYTMDATAGPGKYALSGTTLTLPTDSADYVQVMYYYETEDGTQAIKSATEFPAECELTLSVLVCDACDKETLRHAYVTFPAFQMSPDFDITLDQKCFSTQIVGIYGNMYVAA